MLSAMLVCFDHVLWNLFKHQLGVSSILFAITQLYLASPVSYHQIDISPEI